MLFSLLLVVLAACSDSAGNATNNSSKEAGDSKFPEKSITLMVPFAPGSVNDSVARLLAKLTEKHLPNNKAVVVENVEGGGGIVGMTQLMNAKPDGYSLGYGTVSHVSVLPHFGDAPFTHDSFQPIMKLSASVPMLVVRADAPWNTFDELVTYAKENPGAFNYATTGAGSISNLNMVAVSNALDFEFKNVPYEGGAQGITALLGGNIEGAVVMPSDAKEHIKAGTLKALFVFSQDDSEYETASTLKDYELESGIEAFSMLFAPKNIPAEEIVILNEAFHKATQDPEFIEFTKNINTNITYLGAKESQEEATRTFNLAGELLKNLGLIQ